MQGASDPSAPLIGGAGAQSIRGGDGDDLIYGDFAPDQTPARLAELAALREAPDGVLEGAFRAQGVVRDGLAFVYGMGADPGAGGLGVWMVDAADRLTQVFTQSARYFDGQLLTGARGILTFRHQGQDMLLTGGFGVSLSRIAADGRPELVATRHMDETLDLYNPGAFAAFEIGGALHVLVGGWERPGLTLLRLEGDALVKAARYEDDAARRLDGVAAMASARLAGRDYAITLSRRDEGLSVWRVDAEGLTLTDMRSRDDAETDFALSWASGLAVAARDDAAGVYAAGEDGLLAAWRLDAEGRLTRIQSLPAATDLAHARLEGRDWIFAARADGTVTVYEALADLRLVERDRLALGDGAALSGLGALVYNDRVLLTAGRADGPGYDMIAFRPEAGDVIDGGGGNDRIWGGPGPDQLKGGAGDDQLWGEDHDDRLWGGDGADQLDGGAGNDALFGGAGADRLIGAEGDDWLAGEGGADVLQGGAGDDVLDGGAGGDVLEGGDGDDRLTGGEGDDSLAGGAGDDELDGGAGNDELDGGDGADLLLGGDGIDALDGGAGADRLEGGGGDDVLSGGDGADALLGGAGNDRLDGGAGNDALDGGDGADALFGGAGADALTGGAGDDALDGGAGNDVLDGGDGDDALIGGDGDDALTGGAGADRLEGGAGADALTGGAGDDALDGGGGNDVLAGGAGADALSGGADEIRGGDGDDALRGGGGADKLWGDAGDDAIFGGAGADKAWGGGGRDQIDGGGGSDQLWGGGGADALRGKNGADALWGGAGADQLLGGNGDDRIAGGGGADKAWGGGGRDRIEGGGGNDKLWGGGGADQISGGAGADQLWGGAGNDRLEGGGGRDRIAGGAGADLLLGGAGADVFVFARGDGRDSIADFTPGEDVLSLEGLASDFGALDIRQQGEDTIIEAGNVVIVLLDLDHRLLHADDFLFS